jgi:TonB-dependent SusC/RagA subfamily outer membrane receptor
MKLDLSRNTVSSGQSNTVIRPCLLSFKRLFFLFSFIIFFICSQAQTISLAKKRMSAEKVINAIQQQSGYNFLYASDVLQEGKKADIAFDKLNITQALDAAISNQPFVYELIGKTIVLKNRVENKSQKGLSNNGNDGKEEEMVNNGYTKTSKRQSTGSSSLISREDIERNPATSMLQLLSTLPGVMVSGNSITIRGATSIMSSTDPLIIVDGISFPASGINSLDPNMVQNVTVLKDGAETAIYGSRGANGVIVIATRHGGKTGQNNNFDSGSIKANNDGSVSFNNTHITILLKEIVNWYGLVVSFADKSPFGNYYGRLTKDIPLSQMLYILESAGIKLKQEGKIIIVTG